MFEVTYVSGRISRNISDKHRSKVANLAKYVHFSGGRYHYQSIDTFDVPNSKDSIDTFLKYRCFRYLTGYG